MLPKGYGLPKVHNPNIPLKIVISTFNGPCHRLPKILYKKLELCIEKPQSHIDNSFALNRKLKILDIPAYYILLYLDVTSLFTNIILEAVLNSLEKRVRYVYNTSKIPFYKMIEMENRSRMHKFSIILLSPETYITIYHQKLNVCSNSHFTKIFFQMS